MGVIADEDEASIVKIFYCEVEKLFGVYNSPNLTFFHCLSNAFMTVNPSSRRSCFLVLLIKPHDLNEGFENWG